MPTVFDYVVPLNKFALVIVWILWTVFTLWLLSLVIAGVRIFRHANAIRALNNLVPELAAARMERDARRSRREVIETTPSDDFREHLPPGLSHRSPIVRHVEAIFSAGCTDSRLDVRELLEHTERELSAGDGARRSFLSIFLIIGLLGTLFGLADSIQNLLAQLRESSHAFSNLDRLLTALKGAFAPSISGVLSSVLGTIVYALYQKALLYRIAANLRECTINLWVPELYPTTGQMAVEAAQRSIDAAFKVTDAAQHIREDTASLASTLRTASVETAGFVSGMTQLSAAIREVMTPTSTAIQELGVQLNSFGQAVSRWSAFEQSLKTLYETLATTDQQLLEQTREVSRHVQAQTTSLQTLSGDFKNAHATVFTEVRGAYEKLGQRMDLLQVPFKDAAEQLLNTAENFRRTSEGIVNNNALFSEQVVAKLNDLTRTSARACDLLAPLEPTIRMHGEDLTFVKSQTRALAAAATAAGQRVDGLTAEQRRAADSVNQLNATARDHTSRLYRLETRGKGDKRKEEIYPTEPPIPTQQPWPAAAGQEPSAAPTYPAPANTGPAAQPWPPPATSAPPQYTLQWPGEPRQDLGPLPPRQSPIPPEKRSWLDKFWRR